MCRVCVTIWSTDCDRLLVAMVSLEKLWVLNMKEHCFQGALQPHLEEVLLLMPWDRKEKS